MEGIVQAVNLVIQAASAAAKVSNIGPGTWVIVGILSPLILALIAAVWRMGNTIGGFRSDLKAIKDRTNRIEDWQDSADSSKFTRRYNPPDRRDQD